MFWIFAAVVLVLMVVHRGFRKVAFWIGGAAAALGVATFLMTALPGSAPRPTAGLTGDPAIDAAFPSGSVVADASCTAAKKNKDERTAFFACSTEREDPNIPTSALK